MEDNLDVMRLNNMVFYAYHGVENAEKQYGQRFEVDAELYVDLQKAGLSDQLMDTVDYTNVYQVIEEIVMESDLILLKRLLKILHNRLLVNFQ